MDRFFRTRADRQKNSPFKNEAFTSFGSSSTKAILNSRLAPPYGRVRVPLISPEIIKAKLDKSSFEQEDEDNEKKDEKKGMKDAKESAAAEPLRVAQPDEDDEDSDTSFTSTSSGSDTTSSSSSEVEDCEEGEECPANLSDEQDEALISQSSGYLVKQIKAEIAKGKSVKKLEVKNEPLFNKPLELCEASLQYLDEKCSFKPGKGEAKKIIKQSQEEYQRNRKAFRDIRRKDWEKRHQRREQRREVFKKERELEGKEEKQSIVDSEMKQSTEGVEQKLPNEDDEETETTESDTETESCDEDEELADIVQSVPLD